ncbi:hemopexin repeat-containing protein [Streptomyces sp. P6-2-1]|uniref:hemopexin repeat-containing protein n=1 Tax=unclassified Streptomyces TaxID=2593676 RepID=UPI003D36BF6B
MATDVQDSFYRRIDAALRSRDDGHIVWIFKDKHYLRYDLNADKGVSSAKAIEGNWSGLADSFTRGVDAALNRRDQPGVGYLFKDDQYVRWNLETDAAVTGYPKSIAEGWSALPEAFQLGVDAVVNHQDNPKIVWFFKDDQYVRYDVADNKLLAGPKTIAGNWHGLPDSFNRRIDAAIPHATNRDKVYLFKDDQYVRYDLAADRADSGYPLAIRGNWKFFQ